MNPYFGLYPGQLGYINPGDPKFGGIDYGNDDLLNILGANINTGAAFATALEPRRQQSILDLLAALDPSQDVQRARTQASALLGQARSAGVQNAARLRQGGFGRSAQMGAELDARNRALSAGQDNLLAMLSGDNQARRYAAMSQAAGASMPIQAIQARMALQQQQWAKEAQNAAERGGGFLGGLLDIGSAVAPYLGGLSFGRRRGAPVSSASTSQSAILF